MASFNDNLAQKVSPREVRLDSGIIFGSLFWHMSKNKGTVFGFDHMQSPPAKGVNAGHKGIPKNGHKKLPSFEFGSWICLFN